MWHLDVAALSASAKSLERPRLQQKCLLFCIFPTGERTLSKLVSKEIFFSLLGTTAAVNHSWDGSMAIGYRLQKVCLILLAARDQLSGRKTVICQSCENIIGIGVHTNMFLIYSIL